LTSWLLLQLLIRHSLASWLRKNLPTTKVTRQRGNQNLGFHSDVFSILNCGHRLMSA
jgi:hypothetical protein